MKKRGVVVFVALVCGLVMAPNSGYSQDIEQADIYITPATELDFFSGYFGGDGDFSNIDEWIDWSIGNSRPFSATRTDAMVFSTCENGFLNPADWKERMRITKAGNVGIGTDQPGEKLQVAGTVSADAFVGDGSGLTNIPAGPQGPQGDTGPQGSQGASPFGLNGNNAYYTAGYLGLGTTDPLTKLDVRNGSVNILNQGAGNVLLHLSTERSWQLRQFGSGATTALELASVGGGGNKNFLISTDGNVGIGTTNPTGKLHLAAGGGEGLRVDTPYGNIHLPWKDGNSYINGKEILFRTNGNNERMRIYSNGQITMGGHVPFTVYSLTAGAGYFHGTVNASGFVDRTPYPKDLETAYAVVLSMDRLPPGEYDENDKENQLDHSKLHGFIQSQDGTSRDLSATVSAQNEVIKDLLKRIEELEAKLN